MGQAMRHRDTIELYQYWNELRAGQPAPMRSSVAPAGLGRLLPSIMLLDRTEDGDTVFRLAGSRLCALRGAELRGTRLVDIFNETDRPALTRILQSMRAGGKPVLLDIMANRRPDSGVAMDVALLPLADDTTQILGIATLLGPCDWIGILPASFELRGVRFIEADAKYAFLQSRPTVPLLRRRDDQKSGSSRPMHVIAGQGKTGIARPLRAFRVFDGGKK